MPKYIHNDKHPLAGKTVMLRGKYAGSKYTIEDWWDRVSGSSWKDSTVIAAYNYSVRASENGIPSDDEVVYGKIGAFGYLVHISELGEETTP